MRLVDTHCHLQDPAFDGDRDAVLARALDELEWLVIIGDDVNTSRRALEMTGERVYATVGIHPHNAQQADARALAAIRELTCEPGAVALGEIGLDYHYEFAPHERQKDALRAQLDLAAKLDMPVVIHCREAHEDMAAVLEPVRKNLTAIMHCFGGDAAEARCYLAWGFYISFAGNVTFPKAAQLREAARAVPLDRLLVETDSPYLAPQPVRGKRCEPIHVRYTAEMLAELKGIPVEELVRCTTANAKRVYRVK